MSLTINYDFSCYMLYEKNAKEKDQREKNTEKKEILKMTKNLFRSVTGSFEAAHKNTRECLNKRMRLRERDNENVHVFSVH